MQRTPINPWSWAEKLGFDQAQLIEGAGGSSFAAARTRWTPPVTPSTRATWPRNSSWPSTTWRLS